MVSFHGGDIGANAYRPPGERVCAGMIDLNRASPRELDTIPLLAGHGFEIARYREERGRFTSLRQLDEVPGLAGKTAGIEEHLTIG